jgi:hypothetical protein
MNNTTEIVVNSKHDFIEKVKKWATLDDQLKHIGEKTKQMRLFKGQLGEDICKYMNENHKHQKKIGITNGELGIYEKKEYSPLTFGYIEQCLDELIPDKEQVAYVISYLKEHRKVNTTFDLRRTNK